MEIPNSKRTKPSKATGLFDDHLSAEKKKEIADQLFIEVKTNATKNDWNIICAVKDFADHRLGVESLKAKLLEGLHAQPFTQIDGAFLPLPVIEKLLSFTIQVYEEEGVKPREMALVRLSFDGANDIFKGAHMK